MAKEKVDLFLKGVPGELVEELDRRSEIHFRSRSGEILSILASVCRNKIELPPLPIGDGMDMDGSAQLSPEAGQDGPQSTGSGQGGERWAIVS